MEPLSAVRAAAAPAVSGAKPLSGANAVATSSTLEAGVDETQHTPFSHAMNDALQTLVDQQRVADSKVNDIAAGRNDDLIGAMVAMNKASLSMTFALEVRNRIVDAYHEVMRMQA